MSALTELLEALRAVQDQLDRAHGQLRRSRSLLAEAEAALRRLDPEHPESVVPPGLHRADHQLERTETQLDHIADTLRGFASRL